MTHQQQPACLSSCQFASGAPGAGWKSNCGLRHDHLPMGFISHGHDHSGLVPTCIAMAVAKVIMAANHEAETLG